MNDYLLLFCVFFFYIFSLKTYKLLEDGDMSSIFWAWKGRDWGENRPGVVFKMHMLQEWEGVNFLHFLFYLFVYLLTSLFLFLTNIFWKNITVLPRI